MAFTLLYSINTFAADKIMPEKISLGDPEVGSSLVSTCAACHGSDGNSLNGSWPNLLVKTKNTHMISLNIFKMGLGKMSSCHQLLNI